MSVERQYQNEIDDAQGGRMNRSTRRCLIHELTCEMAAALAAGDFCDWHVLRAQRDGWEWLFDAWRQDNKGTWKEAGRALAEAEKTGVNLEAARVTFAQATKNRERWGD